MYVRFVSLDVHPLLRGVATPVRRSTRAAVRPPGLLFFRARCTSFHAFTPLSLPYSSVSLSYFILAVAMYKCWLRSLFPVAILNGTCFFSRNEMIFLGRSFACQKLAVSHIT